jgi:hypothetical protein
LRPGHGGTCGTTQEQRGYWPVYGHDPHLDVPRRPRDDRHTLPSSVGVEDNRAPNGDRHIWLDPRSVDGLRALRRPGESYSDVFCSWREGEQ